MNRPLDHELLVGTKVKFGPEFSKAFGYESGLIIELVEGTFEEDNGLYMWESKVPSIWNEQAKDFDSIYHLFGNELEDFMDCEIVSTATNPES